MRMSSIVRSVALVAGVIVLGCTLLLFTMRISLIALLFVALTVLLATAIRTPTRLIRRGAAAGLSLMLAAAVPVDVAFMDTGHKRVRLVPVVWGLPTRETAKRAQAGEVVTAGCMVPPYPARYVVLVSW
jgi:hypothetical protein